MKNFVNEDCNAAIQNKREKLGQYGLGHFTLLHVVQPYFLYSGVPGGMY
jgi:hypothetical protein